MGLKYNKGDQHSTQDSMWTSYSDLFLGLSVVFLLLYVVASIRQGTDGINQMIENKDLKRQVEDLKQQISIYDSLKKDYLNKEATEDEQESYKLLMDKLSLLQDEANDEKRKLIQKAKENENKELALNKYQQMIRNIINANMLQKTKIKKRENLIENKDKVIVAKSNEISELEDDLQEKQSEIAQGEKKIANLETTLDKQMNDLKKLYKQNKITKKKFQEQQARMKAEAEEQIQSLKSLNRQKEQEVAQYQAQIDQTNSKLANVSNELANVSNKLTSAKNTLNTMSSELKGKEAQLADVENKNKELGGKYAKATAALSDTQKQYETLGSKYNELGGKYSATQAELARAKENLNAKKKLAAQIKKNFGSAGVSADVDLNTGDVVLSFGEHYFDTGKAMLKPEMEKILEKAMPAYSTSLFQDNKISEKIQNIEIIGFASPTFKGKYIDPNSLDPMARKAVNYNLDLSYDRAKSIFNHIFNKDKMKFRDQEKMYPLVKVSGRSYLGQGKGSDYCSKNDCAKMQRVIIKFTLKD